MTLRARWDRDRVRLIILAAILLVIVIVLAAMLWQVLGRAGDRYVEQSGITPLEVITGPGSGEHPTFGKPMGVAINSEGHIYVTDATYNRVCVFDREGRFLFEFGGQGVAKPMPGVAATWRPGLMNYPVGIDVDEEGQVYVADFRNDQVQVFSPSGAFIRAFPDTHDIVGRGSSGQDGRGIAVTDVAVRGNDVYATDSYQVFVFDREGRYKRQFGRPGRSPEALDHPNGVAAGDGIVYVSDSNNSRVQAFTNAGAPLWSAGRPSESIQPTQPSDFTLPRGLTVLDDGSLLVADAFQFAIVAVSPEGRVTARYGDQGQLPGQLLYPNDVDALGNLVVIADKDNRRVQFVRLKSGTTP